MRNVFVLLLLIVLWLLLSGLYKTIVLFFGAVSVAIVMAVMSKMNKEDGYRVDLDLKFKGVVTYTSFLILEIVKSNTSVIRLLLSRNLNLNQKFVDIKFPQKSEVGKVVFANSITLTPGTVTVEIDKEKFLVHALNADASTQGELETMGERVLEIEK